MAKAPVSGYAKTRLTPALDSHGAAVLAEPTRRAAPTWPLEPPSAITAVTLNRNSNPKVSSTHP
jgi:glycosyltransferase A (GT-A) superfamily protein (DUF2064 family)